MAQRATKSTMMAMAQRATTNDNNGDSDDAIIIYKKPLMTNKYNDYDNKIIQNLYKFIILTYINFTFISSYLWIPLGLA